MEPGTYTILLEVDQPTQIRFGAAGTRTLKQGWYTYTGSAFGPGGLSRVKRHRRVHQGANLTRHWHIDYLLGATESWWDDVWMANVDAECRVVSLLPGELVAGIGATDCDCEGHLVYHTKREPPVTILEQFYGTQSKATHSDGD